MTKYTLPEPGGLDLEAMTARLEGNWTVTSDYHLPYYSKPMVERMLRESQWMGIENLLIAGDLFDFGYLSDFARYVHQGVDLNTDHRFVRQVLEVLFDSFHRVFYLPGNHTRRLQRALRQQATIRTIFTLFTPDWARERVETTEFPHVILKSGGETFRVTHPQSFSKVPTKVASELALIHKTSVISAHGHHFGLVVAPSGDAIAADSGGMFDPRRIDYLHTDGDTTHGKWAPGFLIVREGNVHPYSGIIGG